MWSCWIATHPPDSIDVADSISELQQDTRRDWRCAMYRLAYIQNATQADIRDCTSLAVCKQHYAVQPTGKMYCDAGDNDEASR